MESWKRGRARLAILSSAFSIASIFAAVPSEAATAVGKISAQEHAVTRGLSPSGVHRPFLGVTHSVCAVAKPGDAACLAQTLQSSTLQPNTTVSSPTGLSPSTIKGAYGFTGSVSAGAGQTIAIAATLRVLIVYFLLLSPPLI